MRSRHVEEKVDRERTLQVDERPSRRRQTAPRCAPQLVRKLNQSGEQARVIELAQQGLVLFGQAGRQRSELAPKRLEGRDYIRGTPSPIPKQSRSA